jgi:hypothetical protein
LGTSDQILIDLLLHPADQLRGTALAGHDVDSRLQESARPLVEPLAPERVDPRDIVGTVAVRRVGGSDGLVQRECKGALQWRDRRGHSSASCFL